MSWAEEQDWFGLENLVEFTLEDILLTDYRGILWKTKDFSLIPVREMTTSHIKNCIKMICRSNGTWRSQYLRVFKQELEYRKHNKEI